MHYFASARLSENMSHTPEGFLLCTGVPIARTGELTYAVGELKDGDGNEVIEDKNGIIKVTRSPEDLFSKVAMASLEGKSITINHPTDFVSPQNWKEVTVGHMQNIRPGEGEDADKLLADLLVIDGDAIAMVLAGLREVSLGYDAEYEQIEPGLGRQTNIVGNHVALVRKGRNGSEVAVRDSAPETTPGSTKMSAKLRDAIKKLIGRAVDEMPDEMIKEEPPVPAADEGGEAETRMANIEVAIAKLMAMLEGGESEGGELVGDEAAPAADVVPVVAEEDPTTKRLSAIESALASLIDKCGGTMDAKALDAAAATFDAATISCVEILAPGTVKSATMVKDAISAFGKTPDGVVILKTLDSIKDESALLVAAAEMLKVKREGQLTPTIDQLPTLQAKGAVSPEDINKANAAHYGIK